MAAGFVGFTTCAGVCVGKRAHGGERAHMEPLLGRTTSSFTAAERDWEHYLRSQLIDKARSSCLGTQAGGRADAPVPGTRPLARRAQILQTEPRWAGRAPA